MNTVKLLKGTLVYHGTDNDDFDEQEDGLDGPAWVSRSYSVAEKFGSRNSWGGTKRVITYVLGEDVELPEIQSARAMQQFAEDHGLDMSGTEDLVQSVLDSGIDGWVIPNNYPDGDDILLVSTSCLDWQATTAL